MVNFMISTYKIIHFCLKLKEDRKLYKEMLSYVNIVSHFKSSGQGKSDCLNNGRTVAKMVSASHKSLIQLPQKALLHQPYSLL